MSTFLMYALWFVVGTFAGIVLHKVVYRNATKRMLTGGIVIENEPHLYAQCVKWTPKISAVEVPNALKGMYENVGRLFPYMDGVYMGGETGDVFSRLVAEQRDILHTLEIALKQYAQYSIEGTKECTNEFAVNWGGVADARRHGNDIAQNND